MAYKFKEMIAEDWKKEYEKVILSRKYAFASSLVGTCSSEPTTFNLKRTYGAIIDYIVSIPVGHDVKGQEVRTKLIGRLDEIKTILYGDPKSMAVTVMFAKYGIQLQPVRRGVRLVDEFSNIPDLVVLLRDILIEAGDFATDVGLRITLHKRKKIGMSGIMEREGFDNLNLEGVDEPKTKPPQEKTEPPQE